MAGNAPAKRLLVTRPGLNELTGGDYMKRIILPFLIVMLLSTSFAAANGAFHGKKFFTAIRTEERAAFDKAELMQVFALPIISVKNVQYSYKMKILPESVELGDELIVATNPSINFTVVYVGKDYAVINLTRAPKQFLGKETAVIPLYTELVPVDL